MSRKVEDEAERNVIRERLDRLDVPEGCGVIVRTNAADPPQRSLNRDLNALLRLWKKVRDESAIGKGPGCFTATRTSSSRRCAIRWTATIDEILVDDAAAFAKAEGFMQTFMPRGRGRIHYTDRLPLFSSTSSRAKSTKLSSARSSFPRGGYIVIDETEALTAIDVNSGRATRAPAARRLLLQTNLEAADEVARQLRLRDIGGLVVVDFIDMRSSKHRRNVEKAMRDAMKDDKAKHTTSRLSDNGLLEINRQRLKKALQLRTHRPCPTCGGSGTIASPELIGLNVLRRIETRAVTGKLKEVRVSLHPELADAIQNERRKELADLEREFDIRVSIIAATSLHRAEEKFEWTERSTDRTAPSVVTAAVTAADLADGIHTKPKKPADDIAEIDEQDDEPTKTDKPARKRRRGGRKRKKSAGAGEESPEAAAPPESPDAPIADDDDGAAEGEHDGDETGDAGKDKPARKRRRPRRRRKKSVQSDDAGDTGDSGSEPDGVVDHPAPDAEASTGEPADEGADTPPKTRRRRPRRPRKPKTDAAPKPEPTTPGDDPFAY